MDVWGGEGRTSAVFWGLLEDVFRAHDTRATLAAVATVAITQTAAKNLCLVGTLYFTCISCKYVP